MKLNAPTTGRIQKLGPVLADQLYPAFLILGVLVPVKDAWSAPFELALLPIFAWLVWRYGVGGRLAAVALSLPLAWIAWLGASGGWGSESAFEEWDHHSLAAFMTGLFLVMSTIHFRVMPERQLKILGICVVLATGATLVAGLVLHLVERDLAFERLSGLGIFDEQNLGSFVAAFIALIALHLALSANSGATRAAMLTYLVVAFFHILMAGSRGGLLVFPAALALYLLLRDFRAGRGLLLSAAVGVAASAGVVFVFSSDVSRFIAETFARDTHRIEIWRSAWHLSQERPLVGHGLGDDTLFAGRFSHPHNLYLSSLFYGGVPALTLNLLNIGAAVVLAWRVRDSSCRALAMAAAVLVLLSTLAHGSLPITKPDEYWYFFWAPLGLIWGLSFRRGGQA